MNDYLAEEPAKVLTIAGSDSGGAAGLQADLKTFTRLGAYGMSVVTAVTAQNSVRVEAVHPLPADFVMAQLNAVLSDYGAAAVKTGFIGRAGLVEALARQLAHFAPRYLVVDPVLVDHQGHSMFPPAVTHAYAEHLLPLADLVTPNLEEAALLAGEPIPGVPEMSAAAQSIHALGPRWVLLKGGRDGSKIVDILTDGRHTWTLSTPFLDTENTHGSGDTLSAAVCALLAQGKSMLEAVISAHAFTAAAIKGAAGWQMGAGHGPINHWS